ncbi:DNA recombination/repair protein RecA, partial [Candidatus Wolfebacteria bacterium]|nr:DNA recombination/repair protein RecA [Candidatus Wolfebacteria bacterium]
MKKDIEKNKAQDKSGDMDKFVESINEKFGEGAMMRLGEVKKVNVASISTGSFSLDLALGVGGLPKGRIVEIFGPE